MAIVGGGASGLVAAYRLRNEDILLLEAEDAVGGNARAGDWDGTAWPMGAIVTYGGSPAMGLYDELGLSPRATESSYGRTTYIGEHRLERTLWEGGLEEVVSGTAAGRIREARRALLESDVEASREELDGTAFVKLLEGYGPEAVGFFESLLAWFGGTPRSYSAYVGVYLARSQMGEGLGILYPERTSEDGPYTFAGGLGRATRVLAEAVEEAGSGRIWTRSPIVRIEQAGDRVTLHGLRRGRPFTLTAEAVIVAVPKVVARNIVVSLTPEQRDAMDRYRATPFLVVGLAADGEIAPGTPVARVLDGPFATFRRVAADGDRYLYRCEVPLSVEDRVHRLDSPALRRRAEAIVSYLDRLFPNARDRIREVRVWRRGRNWYVPVPAMVTDFQPKAAQPAGRVSFANADSVGPISEFGWAMLAADRAVERTRQVLGRRTTGRGAALR